LNELEIGMDHKTIAKNHSRTYTAIRKRIRRIIHDMHLKGISLQEITERTHMSQEEIMTAIQRSKSIDVKTEQIAKPILIHPLQISPPLQSEFDRITTELTDMKSDIKIIKAEVLSFKKMMKHLTTLVESMYEFETES